MVQNLKSKLNQKEVRKISKKVKTIAVFAELSLISFKNRLSNTMENHLEDLKEKFKESEES